MFLLVIINVCGIKYLILSKKNIYIYELYLFISNFVIGIIKKNKKGCFNLC